MRGFGENVRQLISRLCFFFFKVEISSRTLIPFFRPGSVHSDSASRDDCEGALVYARGSRLISISSLLLLYGLGQCVSLGRSVSGLGRSVGGWSWSVEGSRSICV